MDEYSKVSGEEEKKKKRKSERRRQSESENIQGAARVSQTLSP
jgi:hypothetical protein